MAPDFEQYLQARLEQTEKDLTQMLEPLRIEVRAAISNAYYDARNAGLTMEVAADRAADAVMRIVSGRQSED